MFANTISKKLKTRKPRRGQGMTEYIIIVGLIAILLVGAVTTFKGALENAFNKGSQKIQTEITDKMN